MSENETYLRGLTDEELRDEEANVRFFTDRDPPAGRVDPNFLDELKAELRRRHLPVKPFGPHRGATLTIRDWQTGELHRLVVDQPADELHAIAARSTSIDVTIDGAAQTIPNDHIIAID